MQIQNAKRFLLKLSGEALQGSVGYGIDVEFLHTLAEKVVALADSWKEVVIVIGWGNIFRGATMAAKGLDRSQGDYMGMLATVINGIALWDAIERHGREVRIMSAIEINRVSELFIQRRAVKHLKNGRVVIAVGGSGNPYFTTDSAAVLRALELHCDVLVKGTKVDWVYDKDPAKHSDAVRYDTVPGSVALTNNLRIMDQSALALAKDEKLPLFVCRIEDIDRLWTGDVRGTFVTPE